MNEAVKRYYNQHAKDEDARLYYHAFELPITLHYIQQYLVPGSRIFDAACGTGHYLKELLQMEYQVAGNDLSEENIRLTREKTGNHERLKFLSSKDALDEDLWEEERWDGVLLLGPEYHLIDRKRRLDLLKLAGKSIKKGGYIFTGFMSRTMAMVYGLKNNPEGISNPHGAKELWEKGTDESFIEGTEAFTHAYFIHPEEIDSLIRSAGLTPVNLMGMEGIFGERFELYHQLSEELQKQWLEFIMEHCEEAPMIHNSKHLLSISRKI